MERARRWTGRSYAVKDPTTRPQPHISLNMRADWAVGALDAVDAVVYVIDRLYRIVLVNDGWDRFARANGSTLTAERAIGSNVLSAMHGPERDELYAVCEAIFGGHVSRHEYDIDCSSPDQQRTFRMTITPTHDLQGRIVGAAFVSRDVTDLRRLAAEVADGQRELQRAQEALRQRIARSVRLQRLLSDISERLSSQLNQHAIVKYVTDALVGQLDMAFARVWLWDTSAGQLVLRSSSGIYTATDDRFSRLHLGEYTVGEIGLTRTAFITNDAPSVPGIGDPNWISATGIRAFAGYPLLAHDRLLGVAAFFSHQPLDDEITLLLEPLVHQIGLALERAQLYVAQVEARREAQTQARIAATRAAQLDATLAAMNEGVLACDLEGRLVTVNTAALVQLGVNNATALVTIDDLAPLWIAEHDQARSLGLSSALNGTSINTTCQIRRVADGATLDVTITATPIHDAAGAITGAVAVVRDISQQQALDRLRDDFLSIAAHELKTPVTAIKGYAQLALTRLRSNPDPRRLERALATINDQAERIAHLVQALLDISRIQANRLDLHCRSCDLAGLVRGVVERMDASGWEHCIELRAPDAVPIFADYARIDQVVQNLLDNAAKYSSPDSTIGVEVRVRGDVAQVQVRDRGVGIPPDKQDRIFEPWFQAHADTVGDFGGMGLSLSICKAIVEQHGGRVWFTSDETGSVFCFELPLRAPTGVEGATIAS
jgi:two-component system, OmpR family, phosphate regulon sensor histidine kinase PhoR